MTQERERLRDRARGAASWKNWGPYLSERQWGTVREDYSAHGSAWDYFPHDHARSRAYRWGEDGIAGLSDGEQRLCLSLALWNERDPILKERLFGLTNSEGNHGEDVKEQYFYLDATPSHSYLKMLYKYPQRAFPYADLQQESARRGVGAPEYELLDTGVFADDRYFDVFVEYAQAEPGEILMLVTAHNRGPEAAPLHLVPQLLLRNTWSWRPGAYKPQLNTIKNGVVRLDHKEMPPHYIHAEAGAHWLFTDNETNQRKLWNLPAEGYFKDAFHDCIIGSRTDAVNPALSGTKAGVWHRSVVPAGAPRAAQAVRELRCAHGPAATRGRRVLPGSATRHGIGRRARGAAAGFRRPDLEQAVLQFRRGAVAQGRPGASAAAAGARARTQSRLGAP
jgi:hypothetical protein